MAKTRQEIKQEITSAFVNNDTIKSLYGLTPGNSFEEEFSLVSLENILFDMISFSIHLLAKLFDAHKQEITTIIKDQKKGRLSWYRFMALKFQYGFDLQTDSDNFDNNGFTQEQIANSKIIKYAAVNNSDTIGEIVIKVAGESNNELSPITNAEKDSLSAYFEEIKFAGTAIHIINYQADILLLNLVIYRDPLVIDANGYSIINGNKPVEDAIQEFMKELPFNGEYTNAALVDKLQEVDGVIIPHLIVAKSSWIDPSINGYGQPTNIDVKRIAKSGYFKIENFDNISYVV